MSEVLEGEFGDDVDVSFIKDEGKTDRCVFVCALAEDDESVLHRCSRQ